MHSSQDALSPAPQHQVALRLTYHLLRQPTDQTRRVSSLQALVTLGERVRPCAKCFNLTEDEICADLSRSSARRVDTCGGAGVGHQRDRAGGEFRGRYHVLGGRLSPLDGVGPTT